MYYDSRRICSSNTPFSEKALLPQDAIHLDFAAQVQDLIFQL